MRSDKKKSAPSDLLQSETEHGEIGYPVQVYYIDLTKMYMNNIRWHWHTEVEVIILNHGAVDFLTDDKKIRLHAGQGVLINQNIIHAVHAVDGKANCSLYSMTFHPSFLFGYGNTLMSSKFLVPILSSPALQTIVLDEKDPWQEKILDLVNSVIAANLTKKYGYELLCKSYLCQLWLSLLDHIAPQHVSNSRQATTSLDESRVKQAILYIEKHYAEQITLEQLASSVHISKSECCRCFNRTLQLTPIEYLMKYRIFKAANIIQSNVHEPSSMSELAFRVGFNNASYFNKVFKQFLHCTPSEYKKSIKKDPPLSEGPFQFMDI